jgi:hypothetical protein
VHHVTGKHPQIKQTIRFPQSVTINDLFKAIPEPGTTGLVKGAPIPKHDLVANHEGETLDISTKPDITMVAPQLDLVLVTGATGPMKAAIRAAYDYVFDFVFWF